jgi:16S rRNA (cytosine967-C5)-methyltransferase
LILDACAAPGGKTAHLLECLDAEMIAIDMDEERTLRIHNTLTRLGLKATVLTADAGAPETWAKPILGERQFDAILLDAPCSASGIVRRHPDIPWQRRESDIQTLGAQQARLLTRLWPLLRPEGRLLFCTCSVFKEEGQDRLKAFLSRMQDAHLIGKAVQLLPTSSTCPTEAVWTHGHAPLDHDGFFYALLEKRT